jgi:hypothetical protein
MKGPTRTVAHLRGASRRDLRRLLAEGHRVDPRALEGWAYRGTVLGLPRLLERATWQTFQKTFHRQPETGRLVGWNVRLHQDGLGAPSRPLTSQGVPVTTWPYEVVDPGDTHLAPGFTRGLVIDYGPFAGAFDPLRVVKDPLVALEPRNADTLLGVSLVSLHGACLETPTWFVLEREHPVTFVPPPFSPTPLLWPFERTWANALFDAVLGTPVADRERFWRVLAERGPSTLGLGLRLAVHTLTVLPLTLPEFRRPFFALPPAARLRCVEVLAAHPRLPVRQLVSTLKVLACFALLESPGVRQRLARSVDVEPARSSPGGLR